MADPGGRRCGVVHVGVAALFSTLLRTWAARVMSIWAGTRGGVQYVHVVTGVVGTEGANDMSRAEGSAWVLLSPIRERRFLAAEAPVSYADYTLSLSGDGRGSHHYLGPAPGLPQN